MKQGSEMKKSKKLSATIEIAVADDKYTGQRKSGNKTQSKLVYMSLH
jgi:hypothetical protein